MLKFHLRGKTEFLFAIIKEIKPTDGKSIYWREIKSALIKNLKSNPNVTKVTVAKEYLELTFVDGKKTAWKWGVISWLWRFANVVSS